MLKISGALATLSFRVGRSTLTSADITVYRMKSRYEHSSVAEKVANDSSNNFAPPAISRLARLNTPSYTRRRFFLSQSPPFSIKSFARAILFLVKSKSLAAKPSLINANTTSIFCPLPTVFSNVLSYASTASDKDPVRAANFDCVRRASLTSLSPNFSSASLTLASSSSRSFAISLSSLASRVESFGQCNSFPTSLNKDSAFRSIKPSFKLTPASSSPFFAAYLKPASLKCSS
mmetsp:Transcript_24922/g.35916  ORF Transcript_24922/g.35916 Transcript_24922/m.35916 type:complete len:233 (-) Transcript_24922:166-864(-)